MRAWELFSDVPVLPNLIAYVCLLLNIIIPGSGTILAACMAEKYMANKTQLFAGVFQLLTAIYIIGWLWSIYWGFLIVQRSTGGHREVRKLFAQDDELRDNHIRESN